MNSYRIRIECGNCFSRNNYEVERGVPCNDADLICPNCECCPTADPFAIVKCNNSGPHTLKFENDNLKGKQNEYSSKSG